MCHYFLFHSILNFLNFKLFILAQSKIYWFRYLSNTLLIFFDFLIILIDLLSNLMFFHESIYYSTNFRDQIFSLKSHHLYLFLFLMAFVRDLFLYFQVSTNGYHTHGPIMNKIDNVAFNYE